MLNLFLSLGLAYLMGSIPTSFIFAKIFKKVDIRHHGSGNVGATNVFRVVGKAPAVMVLILDILKGVVAVGFFSYVFFNNTIGVRLGLELYRILLAAAAIGGHVFSIFLGFKGGKGVAITLGVLLVLAPEVLLADLIVWLAVFLVFRIVSVASIVSSVLLPVLGIAFGQSTIFIFFCIILCIAGTYKHKPNIKRLIRGEEKRLF